MIPSSHRYIVIMAGGVGSRFWPVSTEEKPKQFLDILGTGRTLLQMTWDRACTLVPSDHILIVTHARYRQIVFDQLPHLAPQNILEEPVMRNTAPCVAYAALHLQAIDSSAVFAVLPSDHVILKEDTYTRILSGAFDYAGSNNVLLTLGISPTRPDTGYGYIQFDDKVPMYGGDEEQMAVYPVRAFREKPDAQTAARYLQSADYLWNAGMFVWKVTTILDAFEKYSPGILTTLSTSPSPYNTDQEKTWIEKVYPDVTKISIDYAIMEHAENVCTIPADIGWSDLGTWQSLHAYLAKDSGAVTVGKNIHLSDCDDVIVVSDTPRTVVIKGMKDYIVVDDPGALLIYPKSDEQEIRDVVARLTKPGDTK